MKYAFIRTHANDFPVKLQCRQLGVQRSAYYDWRVQPGEVIAPEELALARELVIDALLMAVWRRRSQNKVMIHSDQGS